MGGLSFTWPWALLGLLGVPALVWAYVRRLRLAERRRAAGRRLAGAVR